MKKNLHSLDLTALHPDKSEMLLVQQLNKYHVFRVHVALQGPAFAEDDGVAIDIPLVSLATKDIAPSDVVNDLLTAEDRETAPSVKCPEEIDQWQCTVP